MRLTYIYNVKLSIEKYNIIRQKKNSQSQNMKNNLEKIRQQQIKLIHSTMFDAGYLLNNI